MGSNLSTATKKSSPDMPIDEIIDNCIFNASVRRFPIIAYDDIDFIDEPNMVWSGYLKGMYHGTACSVFKLPYQSLNANNIPSYIETVSNLANQRHPNALIVYGMFQNQNNDVFIALERTGNGSLRDVLDSEMGTQITWKSNLHEICIHTCRALLNYHCNGLVHKDINSSSINVDVVTGTTKLGKYHLFPQESDCIHKVYDAPEVLLGNSDHTQASDVYAFGIILYEIFSRMNPRDVKVNVRSDNYRPTFPTTIDGIPKYAIDLYHSCTEYNARDRPLIKDVLKTLMEMRAQ